MEDKLNELADKLTNIVMERFHGERFTKCNNLEEDEEMDRDWEYLSEKIFGFLWAAADEGIAEGEAA